MEFKYFHLLLVAQTLITYGGVLICYGIAVYKDHINLFLPYISDTGANKPESCYFSEFLSLGAFISAILTFTRYHHVCNCIDSIQLIEKNNLYLLNKISFGFGLISSLGMTLVGNFQEVIVPVHLSGALLAFGCLLVYGILQTFISYKLKTLLYSSKFILVFRIFLALISLASLISFLVFRSLSHEKFKGDNRLKWKSSDGGFEEHIISVISEWSTLIFITIIIITFISDFKKCKINVTNKVKEIVSLGYQNPGCIDLNFELKE